MGFLLNVEVEIREKRFRLSNHQLMDLSNSKGKIAVKQIMNRQIINRQNININKQ